ncbi:MAG: MFS family permease [Dokdonia sp.]|jgi:MFS family permease
MDASNNSSYKNRWAILFIIVMVSFMSTLDSSIVNVAVPVMAKSLNVTSEGIQLVVTSYLVIISATILLFGRLGDIVGKTKVFKFGIALFTIGSLFCGITNSFSFLVLARVIQAIGAAGAMANSLGITTKVFCYVT